MNIWHNAKKERITPELFQACIEISKGSKNKYEFDKETGYLRLDRILYTSTHYPHNYGFIPRTLADDGDPLDVLVLCSQSLDPLTLVKCYAIGVVKMVDGGFEDEKIIAIPFGDPMYNEYQSVDELPKYMAEELTHFLKIYKALEPNKITYVGDIDSREKAQEIIEECKERYIQKYGKKE